MSVIVGIRIYLNDIGTPMADLKTADGVCETIIWTDKKSRKKFEPFINGYTLIYDERPKPTWDECKW